MFQIPLHIHSLLHVHRQASCCSETFFFNSLRELYFKDICDHLWLFSMSKFEILRSQKYRLLRLYRVTSLRIQQFKTENQMWCTYQDVMYVPRCDARIKMWCTYQDVMYVPRCDVRIKMWCTYQDVMYVPRCDVRIKMWCTYQDVMYVPRCDVRTKMWCTYQDVMYVSRCDVRIKMWCTYQYVMYVSRCDVRINMWCTYQYVMYVSRCDVRTKMWCTYQPNLTQHWKYSKKARIVTYPGRTHPVTFVGLGDFYNIGSQVSWQLHYCRREKVCFTKLLWKSNRRRRNGLISWLLFSNLHKVVVNKVTFVDFGGAIVPPLDPPQTLCYIIRINGHFFWWISRLWLNSSAASNWMGKCWNMWTQ